jgi:hypothetical protein
MVRLRGGKMPRLMILGMGWTLLLIPCRGTAQWMDLGSPGGGGMYGFCFLGETVFAASTSGGVYRSTDQGVHWFPTGTGLTTTNVRSVVSHNGLVIAGTLGGGVFVSGDRGASWGPPALAGRYVQALLSYGDLVFAGTEQGIFKSSDRGVSWSPSSTGLTNPTVTALAASSGRLFAGTYGDGVFVSSDLGAQWQWISAGMYYPTILSLTVAGPTIYAGTMEGGVIALSDTNGRWTSLQVGLPGSNVNALLTSAAQILAGTNSGTVHSSAAGWIPTSILQQEIREPASYNHLLFIPRSRVEERNGKFPLILFLHGIDALDGTVGGPSDLKKVKKEGLPKLLDSNNTFPAIVVSPQCPAETEWYYENVDNNRLINRLLDSVILRYPVDTTRIYITGLSMGGIGSYYFAIHNPRRFAAIAPVAARGDQGWDVCAIKDSVWAFHGAKDGTIPLAKGQAVIDSLQACGLEPRFTIYPNLGHDCWTTTYARPDLYEWMWQQRKQ